MGTKITDRTMQTKPLERHQWFHEPFARGSGVFAARITPAGERHFYFRYTDSDGNRPYLKLGNYNQRGGSAGLTVEQARQQARERSELFRSGVKDLHAHFEAKGETENLSAEIGRQRAEAELARLAAEAAREALERERRITVRKLFERWQLTELQPHILADGKRVGRKDGGKFTAEQFERRVFPVVGDMPISDVRKADWMKVLDKVKTEGKLRTANVLLADIKQMLRFAQAREVIERNPLDLVTKRQVGGPSVERERTLSPEELVALANALPGANLGVRTHAALWIIVATGVRVGELMGAVWPGALIGKSALQTLADEAGAKFGTVDLEARSWHLPTTKNQRDHTIHLSDFAASQFEKLLAVRELSPWVFPNTSGTSPVCVKSFGKQLADRQRLPELRMKNRAKDTHTLVLSGGRWTAHDLRRTAATLMAQLGTSTDVIDECLNHRLVSKVARTYIRNRRKDQQAEAFQQLGAYLADLLSNAMRPRAEEQTY